MKKTYSFCALLILGITVSLEGSSSARELQLSQDQMKVEIVNNNHNHNNHKIEVHNEDDPYDCKRYVGDELKKRMLYLPKPILIKNLTTFSSRTRQAYAASLSPAEAEKLLQELDNQDREQLVKILGEEGKSFINALETKVADEKKRQQTEEEEGKKSTKWEILHVLGMVVGLCCGVVVI